MLDVQLFQYTMTHRVYEFFFFKIQLTVFC